jgi:hypothetical protein
MDFFGNRRAFCKSCHESMLLEEVQLTQKKLLEFIDYHRGDWVGRHETIGRFFI